MMLSHVGDPVVISEGPSRASTGGPDCRLGALRDAIFLHVHDPSEIGFSLCQFVRLLCPAFFRIA